MTLSSAVGVIITTSKFTELLDFYRGLFGAIEVERYPPAGDVFYLGLTIGGSDLGLVNEDRSTIASEQIVLSIEVADVNALLPRVIELGGTVKGPPNDMPWGQRVAHIQDPDGNTVNLTQQF